MLGARFVFGAWHPVERIAGDAVIAEEKAELRGVFLDVAQIVELEFEIADCLPMCPVIADGSAHVIV